jgi:hypothetical protein
MTDEYLADLIRRYWVKHGFVVDCRVTEMTYPGSNGAMRVHVRAIVSDMLNGLPSGYCNGVNGVELGLPCARASLWRERAT